MAKKIKFGKVEIPDEAFKDENITAHISIRLPLTLVKELKRLALTEEYAGQYQVLIRDVLSKHVDDSRPKRKRA